MSKIAFYSLLGFFFFCVLLSVFQDSEQQFQSPICFDPLVSVGFVQKGVQVALQERHVLL